MDLAITEEFCYSLSIGGFLFVSAIALFILYAINRKFTKTSIPGPRGFPLIGVVPYLDKNPFITFSEWAREYGPVMKVPLMGDDLIILNNADVIREAFMNDVFTGRPQNILTKDFAKGRGLVATDGPLWHEQRRFALSTLKDFGMGKITLEENIHEEISELINKIEEKDGQPFDVDSLLKTAVSNIIASIAFGKRYKHDDPVLQLYIEKIKENAEFLSRTNMISTFPWLRFLPGDWFKYWQVKSNIEILIETTQKEVNLHKMSYKPEVTRDFIDAYLSKMNQEASNNMSPFTDIQLPVVALDMFGAGMETTATALHWCLLYLICNPHIQERIHHDIDSEVNRDCLPAMKDRRKLKFIDATINEVLRIRTIIPGALPHTNHEEVILRGYRIPKNSTIIPNLWNVHMDPKHWTYPNCFNPDRFLDNNGHLTKPNYFMPFSIGKRVCLGEALAKMELFLILAGLLQKFQFVAEDMDNLPSTDMVCGLTISPIPFKLRAIRRF